MGLAQIKTSVCATCSRVFRGPAVKKSRPEKIMERYDQANGFGKLCLWLDHRDMRGEFDHMSGMWGK